MALRAQNMEVLDRIVSGWTLSLSRADIFAKAQAHGVICAPVQNLDEVVNDPHLLARGSLKRRPHPQLGTIAQLQTPLRYADFDPPPLTDPPALGDVTAEVLAELAGVDAEELAVLQREGVV